MLTKVVMSYNLLSHESTRSALIIVGPTTGCLCCQAALLLGVVPQVSCEDAHQAQEGKGGRRVPPYNFILCSNKIL